MATFNNNESGSSVRTKLNNVLQHMDGTSGEVVVNDAGADVDFRVESDTNANMLFVDAGNDRVGIGTSSPGQRLTVAGAISISGTGSGYSFDASGSTPAVANMYAPLGNTLAFGTASTERMRITSTGNVGIGTTAAAGFDGNANLTVSNAAASTFVNIESSGGSAALRFYRAGVYGWTLQAGLGSTDNFAFFQGAAERMRIAPGGNVGIGTTSPTNLLDVNADSIRVRTAQTPATAGAAGNQGEIAWDADYIYVCTATNTWKRVAIATW